MNTHSYMQMAKTESDLLESLQTDHNRNWVFNFLLSRNKCQSILYMQTRLVLFFANLEQVKNFHKLVKNTTYFEIFLNEPVYKVITLPDFMTEAPDSNLGLVKVPKHDYTL